MKIKGAGGPRVPAAPTGAAAGVGKGGAARGASEAGRAGEVAGQKFADKVAGTAAPGAAAAGGVAPGAGAGSIGGIAPGTLREITGKLAAGEISRSEAVNRLVDAVVAEGPGRVLGPRQREALRAHLNQTLADDPVLGERVRALGGDDAD
ncbi:MAG: hypothetical protein IT370_15860 [Deltaproteobacteria bacterium]|nr:hypothetical protein [Deltaproteobacteria bacterium]